jgi:RimJ/RimL family protein N-acetyltransferase
LEGTNDRGLQADRQRWGADEAARRQVQASKALRHTLGWWQLAYTPDHALVGVIMPSQNDGGPIIDYAGVVPEQRGRGYVNDLLDKGIAVLQADRAARIRSDSDTGNLAMARAFRQTGFKKFGTRVVYEIELSRWSARR